MRNSNNSKYHSQPTINCQQTARRHKIGAELNLHRHKIEAALNLYKKIMTYSLAPLILPTTPLKYTTLCDKVCQ